VHPEIEVNQLVGSESER